MARSRAAIVCAVDDATRRLLSWVDAHGVPPRHDQVESFLSEQGWRCCGEGDWARAYRSPDGRHAARVSPFDPACRFTVRLYRQGAGNPYLPRLDADRRLHGGGCLMLMEFLEPVDAGEAHHWFARLHDPATSDADLAAAARLIERIHRSAQAELAWCGPLDDNPSNVMRAPGHRIRFVDPYYMQGVVLYGKALTAPEEVVAALPAECRRHMLEIPAVRREASPDEIDRMRAGLRAGDRRLDQRRGLRESTPDGPNLTAPDCDSPSA